MADGSSHEADKVDPEYPHNQLRCMLRDSYKGQRWWSFGNGALTVVIIAFSAIAATLAQVKDFGFSHYNINGSELASIFPSLLRLLRLCRRRWVLRESGLRIELHRARYDSFGLMRQPDLAQKKLATR